MRWYHYIIAVGIVAVAVVSFFLGKRHGDLSSVVNSELNALEARAEAKRLQAELGAEAAADAIEERYREKMKGLDNDGRAVADTLRGDPVRLADWLSRIGR